jgi:hypothetical protein
MSRTDQLMSAIQRKFKTPGNALRALGFSARTINEILAEDEMKNRRLARDQGETLSSEESARWFDLIAKLDPAERDELFREFSAIARGEDPDADVTGDRRRRARDEDPEHRRLNGYGMPDPNAADRRRARDRRVAADSAGLPTFEEIWGSQDRRRVAADSKGLPEFSDLFPFAVKR